MSMVTKDYQIELGIEASASTGPIQWTVAPFAKSDDYLLTIDVPGDCTVRVLLYVARALTTGRADMVTQLLSSALDQRQFLLAALTPGIFVTPLSRRPRGRVMRCPPSLFCTDSAAANAAARRARWSDSAGLGRAATTRQSPDYAGDVIRMCDALVCHWDDSLADLVIRLVTYLRGLGPRRLSSLQLILILTLDEASAAAAQTLRSVLGTVSLERHESRIPRECEVEQLTISGAPSRVAHDRFEIGAVLDRLWSRRMLTSSDVAREDLLPPVILPVDEDPEVVAPFLAAARLRGDAVGVTDDQSGQGRHGPWHTPVHITDPAATAADVARHLLADLLTHETLVRSPTDETYEATWNDSLARIRRSDVHADRVVVVTTSGECADADRMKLLLAVLYSGQVPGPVLPVRIGAKDQRRVLDSFSQYAALAAQLSSTACQGKSITDELLCSVREARSALRTEFRRVIPHAYFELLRTIRPKECVNFSLLPLEWLEVDEIPLGILTKVSTLRSGSLDEDALDPTDLMTIYNSVIWQDVSWLPSALSVLLVAPAYPGSRQARVNEAIAAQARSLEDHIAQEVEAGREIRLERVGGSRTKVREALDQEWSVVIYLGHAKDGVLCLPDGDLRPGDLPKRSLLGSTFVLIGCDTQDVPNLSGSVASRLLSKGARGVFASYYPLHIRMADDMLLSLLQFLFANNRTYGDVLALFRCSMMSEQSFRCVVSGPGLRRLREDAERAGAPVDTARRNRLSLFGQQYEDYLDSWDTAWREAVAWWGRHGEMGRLIPGRDAQVDALEVVSVGALASLAWSFSGDQRATLFPW